jgi:GDP-4-dehydro-6-deoxy-D-mannose reductase
MRKTVEVGSLAASRDYISVDDASVQIVAIIERGQCGGIYHVASGQPVTMRELLQQMLAENGLEYDVTREQSGAPSKYDVPIIFADISATEALCS